MDKLDRLKVDFGLKYIENKNELKTINSEDKGDNFEEIRENEHLEITETLINREKKKEMLHSNTIYIDDSPHDSFNEKQKEDIIKIVLGLLSKV